MGKPKIRAVLAKCLVLTIISLVVSCSKKKDESAAPPPQSQQTSAAPASQAQPPMPASQAQPPAAAPGATSGPAAQPPTTSAAAPPNMTTAGASAQPTPAALASAEGERTGVSVAVQELKRTPNAVTLKMTFSNRTPDKLNAWDLVGDGDLRNVQLLDMAGKKKYFVLTDSDGHYISSNAFVVPSGGQVSVWAKFPPLPDDLQKITVQILHFPPLEDIPISK